MKFIYTTLYCLLLTISLSAQKKSEIPTIYVDKSGIMRWADTGKEASFYDVNYTLPFAHAYRAMNYLGKSHKEAIDKDVYHFARLGFNAYCIHVWDVEISDEKGNLIENDHLDLLDYLIAKLRQRNIRVLITTMTNFGNGYPEKNQNTGAFSYLYDKCNIHSDKDAIAAQENYVSQFLKHVNPYTKSSYKDDPYIIGFEINNEPCHSDTPRQTEEYINKMLKAIKSTGNTKPVFYNVSHNMSHVQAYYNTAIQGTTYQWYPIGLVAGHTRKGNFLPYVDNYKISFSNVKGFDEKAKAVYEYDPADITYSYMYPAMARAFRSQGFQRITQFAYDPIDMAWANTEYQTHFLNLAYTPGKAISMRIAAEVAYNVPPKKKYPQYPNDTIFDSFRVSYKEDLSELNTARKFLYSNNTASKPVDPEKLETIAGYGNSPVVKYEGKGAYFLDKLEDGVWCLEVMPDAIQVQDPFEKPSLKKDDVTIAWNKWNIEVSLPDLGENFTVTAINSNNRFKGLSKGTGFAVEPGVYLLTKKDYAPNKEWNAATPWNNILLGEYVAPRSRVKTFSVIHQPAKVTEANKILKIKADITGLSMPDSVIIYTDRISFWSDKNPYIKMERRQGYTYGANIPAEIIKTGVLRYNIVIFKNGKSYTSPANIEGSPLDWDYNQTKYWETEVVDPHDPIEILNVTDSYSGVETYCIPETSYSLAELNGNGLKEMKTIKYNFKVRDNEAQFFWIEYIKDCITERKDALRQFSTLYINLKNARGINKLKAGFVTSDGYTYTAPINISSNTQLYKIPLSGLSQDKTALLPFPYPVFLERYFAPETNIPFDKQNIEMIILSTTENVNENASIELGNIWIE